MDIKKEIDESPWQYLSAKAKAAHLLDLGLMADCSLIVGKEPNTKLFNCHKFVLVSASPVFEAMFCGQFKEENSKAPVIIPDEDPSVFRLFLEFLYDPLQSTYTEHESGGVVEKAEHERFAKNFPVKEFDKLKSLLLLGHKYMIKKLEEKCWTALKELLNGYDDLCSLHMFQLAVMTNYQPIIPECIKILECIAVFENESVYQLDAFIFCHLIKNLESHMTKDLLQYIENYICKNNLNETEDFSIAEHNRKVITQLYESINFMDMKPFEFAEAAKKTELSKFLGAERKFDILAELCIRDYQANARKSLNSILFN